MPHCRSALGAWKHRQKSYQRGFLSRPPAAISVKLPPPPPPPIVIGDEPLEDVLLPSPPPHVFSGVEQVGNRNRVDWNDISDESSDVLEPVPSAAMFSPGAVASFSPSSSGTLFSESFGLSLRLIIREKLCIVKRGGRQSALQRALSTVSPRAAIDWKWPP